jgi:hypothetical protein
MRVGGTRLTYEGFLQFTGGFVEGISIGRNNSGGGTSLVIDLHLRASGDEFEYARMG